MSEEDGPRFGSQAWIREHWDETQGTGPQLVVVIKFAWEIAFPLFVGLLIAGVVMELVYPAYGVTTGPTRVASGLSIGGAVTGVLYQVAGFRDHTLSTSSKVSSERDGSEE
jgi:membrane associated rhomboid family serine protease